MISIHALLAESDASQGADFEHKMNFYPRSPCGERLEQSASYNAYLEISIHALLAESDVFLLRKITITVDISIHALLAESDSSVSTHCKAVSHFYPRSPCGERPFDVLAVSALLISIHALLAESDTQGVFNLFANPGFLSTLSLRRATS